MDGNKNFGMSGKVIVVTGTPCVGKTSVASLLASRLDALHVNLTELAMRENLVLGKDEKRNSMIVDEVKVKRRIREIVKDNSEKIVVVDGHYAASVVPKKLATHVFVLRRDPAELKIFMEKRGFTNHKLWENLASEILDVCLVEVLEVYGGEKVCELDVTSKSVEEVVDEVLQILAGQRKCRVGVVDWLGKLERERRLEEFLKI
ncbi:MAG: adenylate kinase family protein [Candidatus Bathyarchaeia archaeon]